MIKKVSIMSDTQCPYQLDQAVALHCAHLRDFKPQTYVLNGDMVDFVSLSHFGKTGRLSPQSVLEEVNVTLSRVIIPCLEAVGYKIKWSWVDVDAENPALKGVMKVKIHEVVNTRGVKVYWVEGNHENRLAKYLWNMAQALEGLITFDLLFCLKQLQIEYVRGVGDSGNGILKLTKYLTIMHGERAGNNAAHLQMLDWGGSIVMGHTHKEAMSRRTMPSGLDWRGMSSGCMCRNPTFKSVVNYNRGFISGFYDDETGRFNLYNCDIIEADHTTLITPWAQYRASQASPDVWSVHTAWQYGDNSSNVSRGSSKGQNLLAKVRTKKTQRKLQRVA